MSVHCNRTMAKSAQPKVFAYKGAIDLHVTPEVRAAIREIIDQKPKRIVVDMSEVPYVDSSGLAVLIGAKQEVEANGGAFVLAAPQPAVRTILESARLDQYFKVAAGPRGGERVALALRPSEIARERHCRADRVPVHQRLLGSGTILAQPRAHRVAGS